MTSHGKTYTNAFPLNGLKRWQSVGKALEKRWIPVGYALGTRWVPVGSVGKSVGSVGKTRSYVRHKKPSNK